MRRSLAVLAATVMPLILATCTSNEPNEVAAKLVVATAPSVSSPSRAVFAFQPVVQLQTADGQPVAQQGITVTVAMTGGGTLSGVTMATTNSTGAAAFTDLAIAGTIGPRVLTFSSAGLVGAEAQVTITPGPPIGLAKSAGDNQSASAGAQVQTRPAVTVVDADGNAIAGITVNFAVTAGAGSLTGPDQTSNASGTTAVGGWTLGIVAGSNTLTAVLSGVPASALNFSATGLAWQGVQSIDAGFNHTCAVTTSGDAYCWGQNDRGQVGDGTTVDRRIPVAVAGGLKFRNISAGWYHSCGVTLDDAAYCWGYNYSGQLGDGTEADRLVPTAVAGSRSYRQVTAANYHTCGVTTSNAAYCWGASGTRVGDGSNESGFRTSPVAVVGGVAFLTLSALGDHTCGVATDAAGWCWGYNSNGQLGIGSLAYRNSPGGVAGGLTFTAITTGEYHGCGLSQLLAYCWGWNNTGEVGDGTQIQRVAPVAVSGALAFAQLTAGSSHSCGVTTAGAAYCWGRNFFGQVGDSSKIDRLTPVAVAGGLHFLALSGGISHTCGLTQDGVPYCWGFGSYGQLGDSASGGRFSPAAVRPP